MQEHVHERALRLKQHFDGLMSVHVTLSLEGGQHEAEFVVSARRHQFVAKGVDGEDMYVAIDAVAEKLERQIGRFKERLQDHRRGTKPGEALVQAQEDEGQDDDDDDEVDEFSL